MTKNFATKRFQVALATWAQETTRPSAGAGNAAAIGSMWLRNGVGQTRPTELYLKLGAANTAWTKQNLINVNIYNVRDYGAVGDGVTDDTVAINLAISTCAAAGGGEVYFPATANFYAIKKQGVRIGILLLSATNNITLRGDGNASKIKQTGSNSGGDTWMVEINSTSQRISIQDLYFDNALVTDAVEQNHMIQIVGQTGEPGGPTDIDITRCYFGAMRNGSGDAVRFLGDVTHGQIPVNIRIVRCIFNTGGARSAIGSQRGSRRIIVDQCWFSTDQPIHFEPTGTGTDVSPEEWDIVRNIMTPRVGGTQCGVALSGAGTNNPSQRSVFGFNTIILGKVILAENMDSIDMIGNVIYRDLPAASASNEGPVFFNGDASECVVAGNVIVNLHRDSATSTIKFQAHSSGEPVDNSVVNNVVHMLSDGTTAGIATDNCSRTLIAGNLVSTDAATHAILCGASNDNDGGFHVVGNMVLSTGVVMTDGVAFNAQAGGPPPSINGPIMAAFNFISGVMTNGINYTVSGKPFPVPGGAVGNMAPGATGDMLNTAQSVTIEGNSSASAAQITQVNTAAGPATLSPAGIGSLNVNEAGGDGTAMSVKEANTGLTSGWIGYGGTQVVMGAASAGVATTDLFLVAGGADLAVAQVAEVFIVVPRDGRIMATRLRCTAGVGAGTVSYTVRKNGANVITLNALNTATTGSSAVTIAVSAGDRISIRVTKTVGPVTPQTNVELTLSIL